MMLNNKVMAMLKALSGGGSGGSGAPSDWNASEGEPGHVLNRTHYEEVGLVELPVKGFWETVEEDGETMTVYVVTAPIGLEIGKSYKVVWDGAEYECVCLDMSELTGGMPCVVIGNGAVYGRDDTGEPFAIMEYKGELAAVAGTNGGARWVAGGGEVPFSIHTKSEVIKTLDPKFLPSSLQFGETVVGGDTLTWDGTVEGHVTIPSGDDYGYVKISSAMPTVNDLKAGGSLAFGTSEETQQFTITDEMVVDMGIGVAVTDYVIILYENAIGIDLTGEGGIVTEAGIYTLYGSGFTSVEFTINGYTGFETKTVKPMDAKYLPEGVPYSVTVGGGAATDTLTFDGNMDGKESFMIMDGMYLVKVSDAYAERADIIGGTLNIVSQDEDNIPSGIFELSEEYVVDTSGAMGVPGWMAEMYAASFSEDITSAGMALARGTYVLCAPGVAYVSELKAPGATFTDAKKIVSKLPDECMPDPWTPYNIELTEEDAEVGESIEVKSQTYDAFIDILYAGGDVRIKKEFRYYRVIGWTFVVLNGVNTLTVYIYDRWMSVHTKSNCPAIVFTGTKNPPGKWKN